MTRSDRTTPLSTRALQSFVLVANAGALLTLHAWPAHLALHLVLYVVAGLAWVPLSLQRERAPRVLMMIALAMHVVALMTPPRHSDDYHRYLWDGAVQHAGNDPFRYTPDDPALAQLRGPDYAQMNNRRLPTIYPPGAQLAFRVATYVPLPPLVAWKVLVAIGELLTALVLVHYRAAFLWLACPLVLIELDVNAHVEALALLPFALALHFVRTRPWLAGFCLGVASAIKLLPLWLFALVRNRRFLIGGVVAITLAWLPYAGSHIEGSLGEYSRRWRGNDGVFAIVLHATSAAVAQKLPTAGHRIELGEWAPLVTGRARPYVYADELAGLLARAIVLVVFVAVLVLADRAYRSNQGDAVALARIGIGALLLLTPSLHPWYALWLLPPLLMEHAPPTPRVAWLWLIATVPLGHVPLIDYGAHLPWRDPVWTRVIEHAPTLGLLAFYRRRVLLTAK